ncbi:MAG TPA: sodium:solute symporter [Gemmatimonadales bacterium]|nr:sodium:solute symporter [Gemmatimonadales bacterium]
MTPLDLAVIVLYFAATVGLGIWLSRGQTSSADYFLGARSLPSWSIMLSIVATETSALTVISTPGIGARGDLTFLQLPIGYLVGRLGVAWLLLPGYFRGEQETAYARLEHRFGVTTRRGLSLVFIVTRFLGDGVRIFAGAIPLALLTGWSVPAAIVAMSVVTILYTVFGGIKAVIWADVVQLAVYVAGGIAALVIAWEMAGGAGAALAAASAEGKLRIVDPALSFTTPYTLLGGIVGGGMLSAASHGTDHLIVQRLLATRSLRDARVALVGSGVVVILQFLLFLLVGSAIWAAGLAPDTLPADQVFSRFVIEHLPTGFSGLVIAGVLAAAMSTLSSSINALASSLTHDLYASITGERDQGRLFRIGRAVSVGWGVALMFGALGFHAFASRSDTPVVVLALSIASVTYGALLGAYILAGLSTRIIGRDVIAGAVTTMAGMLVTIFAKRLAALGLDVVAPLGELAWPWYVPLGTLITIGVALLSSRLRPAAA